MSETTDGLKLTDAEYERCLTSADKLGRRAGIAAGSWVVDGNTSRESAAAILRAIDECEFEVPASPLAGEWGDDPTMPEILGDIMSDALADGETDAATVLELEPETADDILTRWADAWSSGYQDEAGRSARAMLGETPDPVPFTIGQPIAVDGYRGIAFRVDSWRGDRMVAHMIGDDRTFELDPDECQALDESEYCPGCGQLGCTAEEWT